MTLEMLLRKGIWGKKPALTGASFTNSRVAKGNSWAAACVKLDWRGTAQASEWILRRWREEPCKGTSERHPQHAVAHVLSLSPFLSEGCYPFGSAPLLLLLPSSHPISQPARGEVSGWALAISHQNGMPRLQWGMVFGEGSGKMGWGGWQRSYFWAIVFCGVGRLLTNVWSTVE